MAQTKEAAPAGTPGAAEAIETAVSYSLYCSTEAQESKEILSYGMTQAELDKELEKGFSISEILAAVKSLTERGEPISSINSIDSIEWEPPIPLDARVDIPDFPVDSLPAPVADFVECLAESTQTPVEMPGLLSLGVLATAYQSRYVVEVTQDWQEPLCLYLAAIAPPGERKSAVISALTNPVREFEMQRRQEEAADIERSKTEHDLLLGELQTAKAVAAKGKAGHEEARQRALELSEELANFQPKHEFRLLVDDTTPEKLVDLLESQNGCVSVCSAEGGVFDAMAGRYDSKANFDVYLKGHAGDPIVVDRIGRKSNCVPNPRLTMLLTVQPEVISGLMSNKTFRGRGLCGRFLYAAGRSMVGHRKSSPEPIPLTIKTKYRNFVKGILSNSRGEGGTIRLSREAEQMRIQYQDIVEARLAGEWDSMRDWGGKLVGAMLRIAGLIHCANSIEDPTKTAISAETIEAAIKIVECLSAHAIAAYQTMCLDEQTEDARYILNKLQGTKAITRAELTRRCRGRFSKAGRMDPALRLLEEHNFVELKVLRIEYNNRSQMEIEVNPAVWRK